ncbi:hypothetical protein [Microbispora sp. H11081]|uniref:hypothetical protein n=1 Tax=Microbispora sp. H11081 TaxID=2729107 RepID=UPI0014749962|nr:hypothetical protein [Microbispora sp. H11081]
MSPVVTPVVSPCPHTPACPAGPCLPDSIRARGAPSGTPAATPSPDGGSSGLTGYEVAVGFIRKFAATMGDSAEGVLRVKDATPRFQGWNLAPLAGVPIVGLAFVHRFNTVSDTWSGAAGILGDALRGDGETLVRAAGNYVAADKASRTAVQQTHR